MLFRSSSSCAECQYVQAHPYASTFTVPNRNMLYLQLLQDRLHLALRTPTPLRVGGAPRWASAIRARPARRRGSLRHQVRFRSCFRPSQPSCAFRILGPLPPAARRHTPHGRLYSGTNNPAPERPSCHKGRTFPCCFGRDAFPSWYAGRFE